MAKSNFKTFEDYFRGFPKDVQKVLKQLRAIVHDAAPEATERISYQIPTFSLNGNLVHFAAFKHHIGFYPTPEAIKVFRKELSQYHTAKGSVQFPFNRPLPVVLIRNIVKYRVRQNTGGQKSKKQG